MANSSIVDDRTTRAGNGLASWILGLIVGALGGATLALLTAPRSGEEVRGALKETARSIPERLNELVDDSLDLYASSLNYLQLVVEEQALRLRRAVAAGKLAAAKKREELELGSQATPYQQ